MRFSVIICRFIVEVPEGTRLCGMSMNKRLLTYTGYMLLMTYACVLTSAGLCNKPIAETFNAGPRAMGLLISFYYSGFIVMTVYGGYLADRIGLKPVMVGSTMMFGLSLFGFAGAWDMTSLFTAMLMMGIAGGAVESGVNALFSRMYSDTRVYSLNLLHIFFGIGAFTWPFAGGLMLDAGLTWRGLHAILGGFSIFFALIMAVQKFPEKTALGNAIHLKELFRLAKQPTMLVLGTLVALFIGSEMGINAWIVRYFEEELMKGRPLTSLFSFSLGAHHYSFHITAGIFLTLYWFAMTVGRIFSTIAGKYIPDHLLLRFITLMSMIVGLGTYFVKGVLPAAVLLGLTGFFFAGIFATTIAVGIKRFPEYTGAVSGLILGFSGVGCTVMNAGIGIVAQYAGSIRAGLLFAATLLIGVAACAFAVKGEEAGGKKVEI